MRRDGEGAVGRHDVGVAVRRRLCGERVREGAAGASLVLDEHLLSERLRQLVGNDACDYVGRTARSKTDQDADRPGGVGLGQHHCGGGQECRNRKKISQHADAEDRHLGLQSLSRSLRHSDD